MTMPPSRRQFFTSAASGAGLLALSSLLRDDGLLAAEADPSDPLAPRAPHFAPKAKRCIFIFLAGAPSHIDLYDPKPVLNELHGQPMPESMTEGVRFAFIQKETAVLAGSKRKFSPYGKCGMEFSDLLPNIGSCADDIALVRSLHTEAFNHHPAQLMLTAGVPRFGHPTFGSWLLYGLGSESRNLPGYVVLTAGRGSSGGASNWTSGFLPSNYAGTLLRNQGDPVLHLSNPAGVTRPVQEKTLEAIRRMNAERFDHVGDAEINSRIAAYELAFRMQAAAPELVDISGETKKTLDQYGVQRAEPKNYRRLRSGGPDTYKTFSKNCLLARRLVERGVRCVTLLHASWDHHSNLDEEIEYAAGMLDQPVAALLQDLKQRGLLDETLVVCAGEFGRTALAENRRGRMNAKMGRDHHPGAFSVWMAGGGIQGGQVIGRTCDIGWNITEDPIHMNDLHATLLHQFGFDHRRLAVKFKGLDVRLTDQGGKVVEKLSG